MSHQTSSADDTSAANNASDSANAAANANAGQGGQGDSTSLLQQGQGSDWLPEKYRTLKEGTQDLDIEASARKLADAHKSLEQRMGQGGLLPKTPDDYKVEGLNEDINFDEVRKDPMFQAVLKDAHAAGISNESMQFFMQKYFNDIAPQLFTANQQLSAEDARTELKGIWKDDQTVTKNLGLAARAVKGFATAGGEVAGAADRVFAKFGNDPDFLAFAAAVGAEMQEDTALNDNPAALGDWQSQVDAIRANPAYADAKHPQHKQLTTQMEALYQKRYGTRAAKLGAGAVA